MKETLFTLMLLVSIPVSFTGCAEDMYEDSTSLEDLYQQKVAEFSRKYGVEVRIRKEKLAEAVRTKTLEDLENDIRVLSSLNIRLKEFPERNSLRNRMRIIRKKKLSEQNDTKSGSFRISGGVTYLTLSDTIYGSCSGSVNWTYGNFCTMSVNLTNVASIGKTTIYYTTPNFYYDELRNDISINRTDIFTLDIGVYTLSNVSCSIYRQVGQVEGSFSMTNNPV